MRKCTGRYGGEQGQASGFLSAATGENAAEPKREEISQVRENLGVKGRECGQECRGQREILVKAARYGNDTREKTPSGQGEQGPLQDGVMKGACRAGF